MMLNAVDTVLLSAILPSVVLPYAAATLACAHYTKETKEQTHIIWNFHGQENKKS